MINIMRIFFVALFVILGANLGIELLDSNMTQILKERKSNLSNVLSTTTLRSKMLFVSGNSPHLSLTHRVYDFFTERYDLSADVEVFHTNLRDENAVGFTEVNGEEQFIQVCNTLDEKEIYYNIAPRTCPRCSKREWHN